MKRSTLVSILKAGIPAAFALLLFGCGGSGAGTAASSGTGTFELKIIWPAKTRLIPVDSASIVATLTDSNGHSIGTQTIARPTSGSSVTITDFTSVPLGTVTLTANSYPNSDGSGVAQATGSATGTVLNGQTTTINVTMADTIASVAITPANPTVSVGATQQLTMTAYDASNDVVLTSPSTITWSSQTTADVTVSTSGLASGVATGSSVITVTETESGKSATTTVTVPTNEGGLGGTIQ